MGALLLLAQFSDNEVVGLLFRAYAAQQAYLSIFVPNVDGPPNGWLLGGLSFTPGRSLLVL